MALGLVEKLLLATLALTPDGHLVSEQLAASALPTAALAAPASELWLVFHQRADWQHAFFLPPTILPDELADVAREASGAGATLERLMPRLAVPRLFLYAPYYESPESRLVPVMSMAVDVAEAYFHALVEATLAGESAVAWRRFARERAEQVMRDVPAVHRQEAYASAVADFAAHALATANEIERAMRRQQAAGQDPCRLLAPPVALFALWPRLFEGGFYPGQYYLPASDTAPEGWQTSRGSLENEDKEHVVADLLAGAWSGDPQRDFAGLCAASTD